MYKCNSKFWYKIFLLTNVFDSDCELESDKFKVVSKSSQLNDNGTVFCKNGHMFYEDSFVTNRTAVCDKNAKWSFNSTNLHCYKGLNKDY